MDLKILFLLGALVTGLPDEPTEEYLVNEDVNISTGFYIRDYAVLSGKVNYRTARQIIRFNHNEYENTVVETVENPLFYWFDWNGDGDFLDPGEMFVDRLVEGCSCDIVPYYPLTY